MMTGLYHPDEFRDNCGFGLIAHMKGEASHKLLQTAIESLTCMTHRGGIAADGKTGDGCGLLIQSPDAFLRKAAKAEFGKEPEELFAVGQVFLNPDENKAAAGRAAVEKRLDYCRRHDRLACACCGRQRECLLVAVFMPALARLA